MSRFLVVFQLPADFKAVGLGHIDVQQNQLRRHAFRRADRLLRQMQCVLQWLRSRDSSSPDRELRRCHLSTAHAGKAAWHVDIHPSELNALDQTLDLCTDRIKRVRRFDQLFGPPRCFRYR